MRRKELAAFALILAACVVAGCATSGDTLKGAYINYGRFVAAQEATVNFVADPLVDAHAKDAAAVAMVSAKPFADTLYAAAVEFAGIQQEIEAMKQYGQSVPEEKVLLALQAERKLKELTVTSTPRILEAIRLVRNLRY